MKKDSSNGNGKRRSTTNRLSDLATPQQGLPSTPSHQHPASAPASMLQNRDFPSTPPFSWTDGKRSLKVNDAATRKSALRNARRQSTYSTLHKEPYHQERNSLHLDFTKMSENKKPPSWGTRSTRSSLHDGSPGLITPPASASLSQSNSSSAPILPFFGGNIARSSSRNKLVKRSSSQKVLNGGANGYSTLRRPATSHQRSATLSRQIYAQDPVNDDETYLTLPIHKPDVSRPTEDHSHQWRPFFRTHPTSNTKPPSSRKRLNGLNKENEPLTTLAPDANELPTLLLASSIDVPEMNGEYLRRHSTSSRLKPPVTPLPMAPTDTRETHSHILDSSGRNIERPRTSFTFSEMFPSPSPLTWKIPRGGSLHGRRILQKHAGGRRIVSAPNFAKQSSFNQTPTGGNALGNSTRIYATPADDRATVGGDSHAPHEAQSPLHSPLPPLQRLSSFKINLPETIPSYPTTPHRRPSPSNSRATTPPWSPVIREDRYPRPSRTQRPSGTHSDHTSALKGPETDNDRRSPVEEEHHNESNSNVYDSMRTGRIGSSLSGSKRLHTDAITDNVLSPATALEPSHPVSESKSFDRSGLESADDLLNVSDERNSPSVMSSTGVGAQESQKALAVLKRKTPPSRAKSGENLSNGGLQIAPKHHQGMVHDKLSETGSNTRHESQTPVKHSKPARSTTRRSTPKRHLSPADKHRSNPFQWSEQSSLDKDVVQGDSARPKTVHGRQGQDIRGHRLNSRRGPSPLHLRSQSVPVPCDDRSHGSPTKAETWTMGKKGPKEDWDGDFDFEEPPRISKPMTEGMRASLSSGMLVPKSILESQANIHGQFGQVKELTKLVEELKRMQQHARFHGIIKGQASELWKEAEGIINLATVDDDEHDSSVPHTPSTDFDFSEDEAPTIREHEAQAKHPSKRSPATEERQAPRQAPRKSHELSDAETPPPIPLSRKDSSAKAKSVLENIQQQRAPYENHVIGSATSARKLPFDTTSLKVLVTRAGVVTRALKEEIRKAESRSESPAPLPQNLPRQPDTPPDPPWSQVFHQTSAHQSTSKSPRMTQSSKSPKSSRSSVLGGAISANENDINGHMKVMTVI